jgi:hypothetical protein
VTFHKEKKIGNQKGKKSREEREKELRKSERK